MRDIGLTITEREKLWDEEAERTARHIVERLLPAGTIVSDDAMRKIVGSIFQAMQTVDKARKAALKRDWGPLI